jgi:hypothetical protein
MRAPHLPPVKYDTTISSYPELVSQVTLLTILAPYHATTVRMRMHQIASAISLGLERMMFVGKLSALRLK